MTHLEFIAKENFNNVKISDVAGEFKIQHGFFLRDKNVSNFDYFNNFENIYSPKQIHLDKNIVINKENENDNMYLNINLRETLFAQNLLEEKYKADAVLTNLKNKKIGIFSADCVPILGYCVNTKYIFAVHAGWKGAVSNIFDNLIDRLKILNKLKENSDLNLHFLIGPSIFYKNYEFSKVEMDKILLKNLDFKNFFIQDKNHVNEMTKEDAKIYFDIRGLIYYRLSKFSDNIEMLDVNTFDSDKFTSFRRGDCEIDCSGHKKAKSFISFIEII